MFGGGPGRMMQQETSKPVDVGKNSRPVGESLKPYWPVLILVLVLILINTYSQVITPELTGQSVDCYLTPATESRLASQTAQIPGITGQPGAAARSSNCWFDPLPANATAADYIAGLGKLILIILALYILGAVMGGLQFFLMTYAGQHVLKSLRVKVFNHLHKLSLNYYAENEAGNVMSRITNDMDTLQQAIGFALVR